jgi:hypothetical protein
VRTRLVNSRWGRITRAEYALLALGRQGVVALRDIRHEPDAAEVVTEIQRLDEMITAALQRIGARG